MQKGMEMKKIGNQTETMRMEIESRSENEEFARVAAAVFLSRLDPTVEELDDIKTAVSEAVTNAVIHGYGGGVRDDLHRNPGLRQGGKDYDPG